MRCVSPLLLALLLSGCSAMTPPPPAQQQPAAAPAADAASEVAFRQSVTLLQQARYPQVVQLLEPVRAAHPELPGVLVNLAIAYIHLDRQDEARTALTQVLAKVPEHPTALNWLAILSRREGRFEEAEQLYQRLLDAHPDYALGHLNLGILCDLYLHRPQCALEHYQRYQALMPEQDQQVAQWIADLQRRLRGGEP